MMNRSSAPGARRPTTAARPASKWLVLALLVLSAQQRVAGHLKSAPTTAAGPRFKIIRDEHAKPKNLEEINSQDRLHSSESSSSLQTLTSPPASTHPTPTTPALTTTTTAPTPTTTTTAQQLASQKLHKFAYDLSLSKLRARQRLQSAALDQASKRRKNDKLIKPQADKNSNYYDRQQQQQQQLNAKQKKGKIRVPSLFFDDDGDDDDYHQRISGTSRSTTTTTTTGDSLSSIIYGDRDATNRRLASANGTDLLSLTTERYQPQVQTTLESQLEEDDRSSHHLPINGASRKSSSSIVIVPKSQRQQQQHDFSTIRQSGDDNSAKNAQFNDHQTLRSFEALPVRVAGALRPILLTSGIKVTSELNFSRDNKSAAKLLEGKNSTGSLRSEALVAGQSTDDGEQTKSRTNQQRRRPIGLVNGQDSAMNKLRRTNELAPTRLVFGLNGGDENWLPPELLAAQPGEPATVLFGLNRIGQLHRAGGNRIDSGNDNDDQDQEDDHNEADSGGRSPTRFGSGQVSWQPSSPSSSSVPSSALIRRTSTTEATTKGAAPLAQTSSSAIRVVAGDSSVPLVINSRGLITAAKSSVPARRRRPPTNHEQPTMATVGAWPRPALWSSVATTSAYSPEPKLPVTIFDGPGAATAATDAAVELNRTISSSSASPLEPGADQQGWTFNPNPPYKESNFSSTPASFSASTASLNVAAVAATTRPSIEIATTKRRAATTSKRPTWSQDLSGSSSSSSYSHQQATSAAANSSSPLYEPASEAEEIGPPVNNQSTAAIRRPLAQNIRHKLQTMLKQKLATATTTKKQPLAASNSTAIKQHLSPAPPPLLSSTVANNVASLLSQTLSSLIMSRTSQQQPSKQPTSGHSTSVGQRLRQRLGVGKASASLDRRATSVGSLLFSGFIYGLSVLPALMAITGVNPLSGAESGLSLREPTAPKSGRKTSNRPAAHKRSPIHSDSGKILLANMPYPYVLPLLPSSSSSSAGAAAASLLAEAAGSPHSSGPPMDGGPGLDSSDSTASALSLDPIVQDAADDHTTHASALAAAMGSFSDLHPLIDEPNSLDELRPPLSSNVSSPSSNRPIQYSDEERDSPGQSAMDLEHSMRWQSDFPHSRRKVERDLSEWQQQQQQQQQQPAVAAANNDRGRPTTIYNQDRIVDNFIFSPPSMSSRHRQQPASSARHWPPQTAHDNHNNSPKTFSAPAAVNSLQQQQQQSSTESVQQVPMSQQSPKSQADRFPDERSAAPDTQRAAFSQPQSSSAANLREPTKYVSPANRPAWPMEGDRSATGSNEQQRPLPPPPLSSGSNQYRPPHIVGHSQWQDDERNNFPTSDRLPAASPAAPTTIDFALLGPYEPFLALKPQSRLQPIASATAAAGQYSMLPADAVGSSSRSRRTPAAANSLSVSYGGTALRNQPADSTSRRHIHHPRAHFGPPTTSGHRTDDRSQHNQRGQHSDSQWRAITQPIMRSSNGHNAGAADPMRRQSKYSQSTRRLGSDLLSRWRQQQQYLLPAIHSGPEIIVSQSMAFGER